MKSLNRKYFSGLIFVIIAGITLVRVTQIAQNSEEGKRESD